MGGYKMKNHIPPPVKANHPWKHLKIAPRRPPNVRVIQSYVTEHIDEMRHRKMKLHGKIVKKVVDEGL